MRKFGKYVTWFLFILAILGGIGTIRNVFVGGAKKAEVPQVVEEKHEEETFATMFARDWLTIQQGETADKRATALSSYFAYNGGLKWTVPTVTQIPRQIQVKNVEEDNKDKITYVTLDVVVDIQQSPNGNGSNKTTKNGADVSNNSSTSSASGTNSGSSDKTVVPSSDEDNTTATIETVDANAISKHFYLKVPVVKSGSTLSIMSEPVMLPPTSTKVYNFQPTENLASGDDATKGETFAKNFADAYFTGKSSVDIQPYLGAGAKIEPLGGFETLSSINKVDIFFRGQNDQKKPTEKYFYAIMYLTVQDPTTNIQYAQKLRVYYVEDLQNNNKLLVTDALRN